MRSGPRPELSVSPPDSQDSMRPGHPTASFMVLRAGIIEFDGDSSVEKDPANRQLTVQGMKNDEPVRVRLFCADDSEHEQWYSRIQVSSSSARGHVVT
jgi:hypothetical protein